MVTKCDFLSLSQEDPTFSLPQITWMRQKFSNKYVVTVMIITSKSWCTCISGDWLNNALLSYKLTIKKIIKDEHIFFAL
jgi:hypothetical protein